MKRYKDKILRNNLKLNEYLIITIKFLLNNTVLLNKKNYINNIYNKNFTIFIFLKKSSISQIRNYCIITNRSKGLISNLKISRLILKKYSSKGFINGFFKSSW